MSTSSLTYGTHLHSTRALLWHVVLPLLGTIALIGLYFTPVEAIGCANRGIAAIGVGVISGVAALVTGRLASQAARRQDRSARWWLASTLILLLPLLLLIWPLG